MNISQDLKSHFNNLRKWTTPDGINFYTFIDYKTYMLQSLSNSIVQKEKQTRKEHIKFLKMCIEKREDEKKWTNIHPDTIIMYDKDISELENRISQIEDELKNSADLIMEEL